MRFKRRDLNHLTDNKLESPRDVGSTSQETPSLSSGISISSAFIGFLYSTSSTETSCKKMIRYHLRLNTEEVDTKDVILLVLDVIFSIILL